MGSILATFPGMPAGTLALGCSEARRPGGIIGLSPMDTRSGLEPPLRDLRRRPAGRGDAERRGPAASLDRAQELLTPGRVQAAAALALYLILSIGWFGIPVVRHPAHTYVGFGADPASFVWLISWWPHALLHGLNPFVTHDLWAPSGFNLAGTTGVPGPSLVMLPITKTLGPVVSYNVISLLAPALSAWTAYLLCRHVTGRFWPSLVGGYLFGFSAYEVGHMLGHPNLTLVFLIPVCVLLVLARLEGRLSVRRFVLLLALCLLFQFLISAEVSLTLAVFGVLALGLAVAFAPWDRKMMLAKTGLMIGGAYVLAGVALTPYLYYFFAHRSTDIPVYPFYPSLYSIDLVNPIVPTLITRFGQQDMAAVASKLAGNISEQSAYLGLPVLAMLFMFAVTQWKRWTARFLLALLALVFVAALGPILHVAGTTSVAMPWRVMLHLPLVKYALPSRFMVYAFLAVAMMSAMWLSHPSSHRLARFGLAVISVAFLLPNWGSPIWHTSADTPPFFSTSMYRRYLAPGENVLVIPFGSNGNSMLWQAQTDLYFRMPEGYLTVTAPRAFAGYRILQSFYSGELIPSYADELMRFLRANRVGAIVVDARVPGRWRDLFAPLGVPPVTVGGVMLYRVPSGVLGGAP